MKHLLRRWLGDGARIRELWLGNNSRMPRVERSHSEANGYASGRHLSLNGGAIEGDGLRRIERVVLTDQVSRTLFEGFAQHRRGERGEEETGWLLLGHRREDEVVAVATLPAGMSSDTGVAHVLFNSDAQTLGYRWARQQDKRLDLIGVVHTHPGCLRHPSSGDYRGDSQWVARLRGGEGVFGIGTADVRFESRRSNETPKHSTFDRFARQPEPHMQTLGELCFSWYALGKGDSQYRKLPVQWTLGPDLTSPLLAVWDIIDRHAAALERLCIQQANATLDVVSAQARRILRLNLPLAEPGTSLCLLIDGDDVRYFWMHDGDIQAVDPESEEVDRGVYLILAELAGKRGCIAAGRR